jgi:hypothetical protein
LNTVYPVALMDEEINKEPQKDERLIGILFPVFSGFFSQLFKFWQIFIVKYGKDLDPE